MAVSFIADDRANKVFGAGDLQWKGSLTLLDGGMVVSDPSWSGPWPKLYDDGPYTTGGHEPLLSQAGDNRWGVTVFVRPPDAGVLTFDYGIIDSSMGLTAGWLWVGDNGHFQIDAGQTDAIAVQGITFPPFGPVDYKLVLDLAHLFQRDGGVSWDTTQVKVKTSTWGWGELLLLDDGLRGDDTAGDGRYTLDLAARIGQGKDFPHIGLQPHDAGEAFVFILGTTEYRESQFGPCSTAGVSAYARQLDGGFTAVSIGTNAIGNTMLTTP